MVTNYFAISASLLLKNLEIYILKPDPDFKCFFMDFMDLIDVTNARLGILFSTKMYKLEKILWQKGWIRKALFWIRIIKI
jgi:hypothetical protein